MNKRIQVLSGILLVCGMLSLSACNSGSAPSNSQDVASADVSSVAPSVSDVPASDSASEPAVSENSSQSPAPSQPASNSTATTSVTKTKTIQNLVSLAKAGQVPGIAFSAHQDTIDRVIKTWGKADQVARVNNNAYATYSKHKTVFGYNKGSQIFDVRSNRSDLQVLTLKDIEAALGKPADTTKNGTDTIYIYTVSKQFQLKFIISAKTSKVDHISVFSPKDAGNNMAG